MDSSILCAFLPTAAGYDKATATDRPRCLRQWFCVSAVGHSCADAQQLIVGILQLIISEMSVQTDHSEL